MDEQQPIFHPVKIALFIAAVIGVLTIFAVVIPETGFTVGGKTFYFVSVNDILHADEDKIDVEALIQARKDSLEAYQTRLKELKLQSEQDSLEAAAQIAAADPTRLQYGNDDRDGLDMFFKALANASSNNPSIRIMHYGDSQIEEDRITSYVRQRLQAKFGGAGVGIMAPKGITQSRSVAQYTSENWSRYTAFGKSGGATDGRYGATAIMCKFVHHVSDSIDSVLVEKSFNSGFTTFTPRSKAHSSVRNFTRVRIFMGHNKAPSEVKLDYDGVVSTQVVDSNQMLQIVTFDLEKYPSKLKVTFSGKSSPEVYGISMETPNGVHMDNISMRGSSGTIFRKLNKDISRQMYAALNPKLIILQYGGNVMPYIKSKEKAESYGKEFLANMQRIKSLCPNASFLMIGPSDMSTNINGKMQTYPNLPHVRDALKNAVFEMGGAYFDMYEVMGGENSMPSWVEANPPLAAKDYIHFSPRGAEKIAEIFYESLLLDYEQYLQRIKLKKD